MLAHKQEDGDKAGKRIASEAGRRYIMTPAGATGGGVGGVGRGGGGGGGGSAKASAGHGGSGLSSVAGAVVLGGCRVVVLHCFVHSLTVRCEVAIYTPSRVVFCFF